MTDSLLRRVRPAVALNPLQRKEYDAALALCARRPAAYVMPAMHIERAARSEGPTPGRLWAARGRARGDGGRDLVGVVWSGANVIPAVPDASGETIAALADAVSSRIPRPSALVGEAEVVLPLWRKLEAVWGPARAIRDEQWLMILDGPPAAPPAPRVSGLALDEVRVATPDDFDAILPAAVHMFRGEVGYDPTIGGHGTYEERLRRLIRSGRSYVQYGTGPGGAGRRVVFKAEVGIVGGGVAEVQGVWVDPDLRGCGLGTSGMAAVCAEIRRTTAPTVSLYVNDFNRAATKSYEATGFRRIGTFATVML